MQQRVFKKMPRTSTAAAEADISAHAVPVGPRVTGTHFGTWYEVVGNTNKFDHFLDSKFQARHWCFTWNWPGGEYEIGGPRLTLEDFRWGRYLVYQGEIGSGGDKYPEGIYHYQGYVEFEKPVRLSALKKVLVMRMRLAAPAHASIYAQGRSATQSALRVFSITSLHVVFKLLSGMSRVRASDAYC